MQLADQSQSMLMSSLHIDIKAETLFSIGPIPVTNSMLLGILGYVIVLWLFLSTVRAIKTKKRGRVAAMVLWVYEMLYSSVEQVIGNKKVAKRIAPLPITLFFVIIINYYLGIIPGVGPITLDGTPVFRGLIADMNVTFALAIISMVVAQIYAFKIHGFFGNIGRYLRNPFTDPAGAFEGILELIAEFSRLLALSLRLFGNVFAGEVLLVVVGYLTAYAASVALLPFMVFELFIGAIQAYVFFMLTTVFIALGMDKHDDHGTAAEEHTDSVHSSTDTATRAHVKG